jgi:hypothetical protein
VQVPDDEHTPLPEHTGEQEDDSMLRRDSEPEAVCGSWLTSGIESQMITRLLLPAETAAQTFPEIASDDAVKGIDAFPTGELGRPE